MSYLDKNKTKERHLALKTNLFVCYYNIIFNYSLIIFLHSFIHLLGDMS